ncbi:hypothetical protein ACF1A5_06135 [Streptomyces sp. NPDC014864]|uniref:hypothetical protein n=1 Tax=Streptomyces sp. NPDC014864 TaxID=3364924 RepID=UPI0036FDC5B5
MPPEPEQPSCAPTDAEETTILDPVRGALATGGYGDRFAEDAFDYPSSIAHSCSADPAPTGAGEPGAEPPVPVGQRSPKGRAVRSANGWRNAAVRPRSILTGAAALVVLGGFGLALSTVSDTVTSPAAPAGTAQVSVPKSPTTQPSSAAPATVEPPGDTASPAATSTSASLPPGTGEDRDREEDHRREDQGREDGDNADG